MAIRRDHPHRDGRGTTIAAAVRGILLRAGAHRLATTLALAGRLIGPEVETRLEERVLTDVQHMFQATFIVGGVVAVVALLVWLAGLALALRGTEPEDRPKILRAYATCRLPLGRHRPEGLGGARGDAPTRASRHRAVE
jgi:hypothetical protein